MKTTGAKVKGQKPAKECENGRQRGEDSGGDADVTCGVGGGRESSSHPRSLLSRWHLVVQVV